LGYILHDDALVQQAQRRLNAVVDHMHPNSILFLSWLDKNRLHEVPRVDVPRDRTHARFLEVISLHTQ
jgi:hypothetical protein